MSTEQSDFTSGVEYLYDQILRAELYARKILPCNGPIILRRRQLTQSLLGQSEGEALIDNSDSNPSTELHRCGSFLSFIKQKFNESARTQIDRTTAKINLMYVKQMLNRIVPHNCAEAFIKDRTLAETQKTIQSTEDDQSQWEEIRNQIATEIGIIKTAINRVQTLLNNIE